MGEERTEDYLEIPPTIDMPKLLVEYNEVLRLLGAMKAIGIGDKINFTTESLIDGNSLFGRLLRTLSGESRYSNLEVITHVIKQCKRFMAIKELSKVQHQNLLDDTRGAVTGLDNLYNTYHRDAFFSAQLKILIREVNQLLDNMGPDQAKS